MKTITNNSKKQILFPDIEFSISPKEIKSISDDQYEKIKGCKALKTLEEKNKVEEVKKIRNKKV